MEKNMDNHMETWYISPLGPKMVTWGYTGDTERGTTTFFGVDSLILNPAPYPQHSNITQ